LAAGLLVLLVQLGYGLVEAGQIGNTNATNILFKNLAVTATAGICFWVLGFGFGFGNTSGGFIGTTK
jgi:Amt family ammonium transporter